MKTPQQFYEELGVEGLAKRKKAVNTRKEQIYLKKFLDKKQRILDLACGYGRFTIPLAKQGYNIQGLDISPNLLKKARETAKKQKLNIRLTEGNMTKLPYKNNAFDAIICMWSAFTELPREKEQIRALKEMLRVLDKGGFAFIELPEHLTTKKKVIISVINGLSWVPMFNHTQTTLKKIIKKAKARKYKISIEDFGGRPRTLVWIWK